MNAPKKGDPVRVVIEGEVVSSCGSLICVSGGHSAILNNVVSVEILRPPVKVGDVIETAEQLDALPEFSTVIDKEQRAVQLGCLGYWYRLGTSVPRPRDEVVPATVLYLPDGAA